MRKRLALLALCALLFSAGCCTLSEYDKCRVGVYQENHPGAWSHKALEWDT